MDDMTTINYTKMSPKPHIATEALLEALSTVFISNAKFEYHTDLVHVINLTGRKQYLRILHSIGVSITIIMEGKQIRAWVSIIYTEFSKEYDFLTLGAYADFRKRINKVFLDCGFDKL